MRDALWSSSKVMISKGAVSSCTVSCVEAVPRRYSRYSGQTISYLVQTSRSIRGDEGVLMKTIGSSVQTKWMLASS